MWLRKTPPSLRSRHQWRALAAPHPGRIWSSKTIVLLHMASSKFPDDPLLLRVNSRILVDGVMHVYYIIIVEGTSGPKTPLSRIPILQYLH
jgi:hypothetical protein